LFSLIISLLSAQDSNIVIVTGKIIDAESLTPVSSVFLFNTSKSFGAQSDTAGKFRVIMLENDSIRISCIGYYTEYWRPDFSKMKNGKIEQMIYIKPQIYKLGAVDIFATRWKAFAYEVLNTEVQEDEVEKRIVKWFNKTVDGEDLSNIDPKMGIRIPLPIFTHREKQLKKIKAQQKIDILEQQAKQKYNKQLVSDITKLKGKELDKFMKYCTLDRDFILRTSEYELIIIINDIFLEYQLLLQNKLNFR
ncbi:MAG: hypothetical protein U9Q83_09930, partial [Bacteroidota bacterium]|nr:hypothetical protein [Bacteroidota bacterium]